MRTRKLEGHGFATRIVYHSVHLVALYEADPRGTYRHLSLLPASDSFSLWCVLLTPYTMPTRLLSVRRKLHHPHGIELSESEGSVPGCCPHSIMLSGGVNALLVFLDEVLSCLDSVFFFFFPICNDPKNWLEQSDMFLSAMFLFKRHDQCPARLNHPHIPIPSGRGPSFEDTTRT